MDITVLQEPQAFQPAYNENVFVVHSSNVNSYYRYKYICNIYDATGDFITSLKTPAYPESTSGQCYFNVGRIIENYLSDYFLNASGTPALASGTAYATYGVRFGEEYATSSGSPVIPIPTSGFTAVEYYNIWDACLRHEDMIGYNAADYMLDTVGLTGRWLTNRPRRTISGTPYIYSESTVDEDGWVYALIKPDLGFDVPILYQFFQPGGSDNQHTLTIPAGTRMARVPATYKSAAEYFGVSYPSTTYLAIIQTGGITSIPATRMYNLLVPSCGRYDRKLIHFLNQLGGYDPVVFNMKSERSQEIERKSFQRKVGTLSGPSYSYSQYDRGVTVFDTSVKDKYSFNSDWLTEDELNWLNELVSSPKALLSGNPLTPLVIDTNTFRFIKKQNEPLFQLQFEASFSINSNRQRA